VGDDAMKQIPKAKLQKPNKFQTSKQAGAASWSFFGFWILDFGFFTR
jgi:hypothetical protein